MLALPEAACAFRPGEHVLVRGTGLIAGYTARFEHALGDGLAVVLQEWLGRWVPVTVRLEDLAKDEPRAKRRRRPRRKRRHRA